ncbi:hypothetical protein F5985_08265 [Malikia spinosa]|uniref:Uncharacterized protein n=1 Tax=Malikia spinosa TaxID=86180 RepID=A0A7C9J834_9BURK|nr:hypothetical protein [Malikia spinosa]
MPPMRPAAVAMSAGRSSASASCSTTRCASAERGSVSVQARAACSADSPERACRAIWIARWNSSGRRILRAASSVRLKPAPGWPWVICNSLINSW